MTCRDPNDENFGFGSCRRKPPVIIDCLVAAQIEPPAYGQQIDLELATTELLRASRFPVTSATDWCGKFAQAGAA